MKLIEYIAGKLVEIKLRPCPKCGARDQPADNNYIFCGICLEKTKVKK